MTTAKVKEYKVLLIGRLDVGKTTIMEQFIFQQFPMEYGPMQEAVCSKQCMVDDEMVSIDILEITTHEYAGIWPQIINHAEGLLLAYSITSRISFDEMLEIHQHILQIRGQAFFPTVLMGNKCDLESDRQVALTEGEILAEQLGCPFFEVSAKDDINIKEAFYGIVRGIRGYST